LEAQRAEEGHVFLEVLYDQFDVINARDHRSSSSSAVPDRGDPPRLSLPRVPRSRQAYRLRKIGNTSRPNSSTVRTGSAARLTVNMRLLAAVAATAPRAG